MGTSNQSNNSAPPCTDLRVRTSRLLLVSQQETEDFQSLLEEFRQRYGSPMELDQVEAAAFCLWVIWQTNHAAHKKEQGLTTRHVSADELDRAHQLLLHAQKNRSQRQKHKRWMKNTAASIARTNAQTEKLKAELSQMKGHS